MIDEDVQDRLSYLQAEWPDTTNFIIGRAWWKGFLVGTAFGFFGTLFGLLALVIYGGK